MGYSVKEVFYTLQGEGARAGRPAVFLRFSGCNLWSGREADRADAICTFCDTDFRGTDGDGGGWFADAPGLAAHVRGFWPATDDGMDAVPYVVCTGGEPLLQLDPPLIEALHGVGFEIAVETNGSLPAPPGIDWVCVSPKAATPLAITSGDELKLVYPQPLAPPERFAGLQFRHFFLQPCDDPARAANTAAAVRWCLAHPRWHLSLQTHKLIGIP